MRVFGFVGAGGDGSDIDLLVEASPSMTLLDIGALRHELRELLDVNGGALTLGFHPPGYRQRALVEAQPE